MERKKKIEKRKKEIGRNRNNRVEGRIKKNVKEKRRIEKGSTRNRVLDH
nr:hypothetical protein [Lactiplantibacillus plantarum]